MTTPLKVSVAGKRREQARRGEESLNQQRSWESNIAVVFSIRSYEVNYTQQYIKIMTGRVGRWVGGLDGGKVSQKYPVLSSSRFVRLTYTHTYMASEVHYSLAEILQQ